MPRVIVERTFETPFTQEELRAVEARMGPAWTSTTYVGFAATGPPIACVWSVSTMRRMWRAYAMSSARLTQSSTALGPPTCLASNDAPEAAQGDPLILLREAGWRRSASDSRICQAHQSSDFSRFCAARKSSM